MKFTILCTLYFQLLFQFCNSEMTEDLVGKYTVAQNFCSNKIFMFV